MFLSANLFDIRTSNAIRYFVRKDSVVNGDPDGYRNTNMPTGSQGIEVEYKYKSDFGLASIAYSYYTVANNGVDSANMVPQNNSSVLGIAQHKLTVILSYNIKKNFFVTPSIYYLGKRFGVASVDANGNGIVQPYSPQAQYNLYFGLRNLFGRVSVGAGVNNITDERIVYLQAYNSLHAPLPGMGREYFLKINYSFTTDKAKI